ncbi:MAG: hypothetical protein ACYC2G_06805 [Gemmatimonadaceae bacterium]
MIASLRPPSPVRRTSAARGRRALLGALAPLALLTALAGCDEKLETTATCPELCPEQQINVQQVELQPVVFDTTVVGFPLRGQEPRLLVAGGDTIADVRGIYRFDDVRKHYTKADGDTALITQTIAPTLRLLHSRAESRLPAGGATLEVYDVDAAGADTSVAGLAPLFVPERLLGTLTVMPPVAGDTASVDTLRISLDPGAVLARVSEGERIRVGVRAVADGAARFALGHGAQLFFRAVPDTAVAEIALSIASDTPADNPLLRLDLASFPLIVRGTAPLPGPVLTVGGLPARRSMLRFQIPAAIIDSSTIVRATLVLTQYPVRGYPAGDSVVIRPLPVTTAPTVTDLSRLFSLAANPTSGGNEVRLVPRLTLAPEDSGQQEFVLANLVTLWSSRSPSSLLPLLVLEVEQEGATSLQAAFFSAEAPAALRPTLRLSYVRRINFDLP